MSTTDPDAGKKGIAFDQVLLGEFQAIAERRQALGVSVAPSPGASRSAPHGNFWRGAFRWRGAIRLLLPWRDRRRLTGTS